MPALFGAVSAFESGKGHVDPRHVDKRVGQPQGQVGTSDRSDSQLDGTRGPFHDYAGVYDEIQNDVFFFNFRNICFFTSHLFFLASHHHFASDSFGADLPMDALSTLLRCFSTNVCEAKVIFGYSYGLFRSIGLGVFL